MINSMEIINENGEKVKINIIVKFRVEELNKEYIAYTVNDDGKSSIEPVAIVQIVYNNNIPAVKLIPEEEKNLVLTTYDYVRDVMTGER